MDSRTACENALREHKERNIELGVLSAHNIIIDRMLERHLELAEAYDEIYTELRGNSTSLFMFFDALLCITDQWSPEKVAESRAGRNDLKRVNSKIAKVAEELATLLDERESLNNHSGFYSDTHYDICQVIEDASAGNGFFNSQLKKPLSALKYQFDMKYWPNLAQCIRIISRDAEKPEIRPSNSTTAAAATGSRAGAADFFKAFVCRLKEEGHSNGTPFPRHLILTDATLASLANIALDRDADALFTSEYVKRWRQVEREVATQK